MSIIRDESLWESGETKINWVKANMPLLRGIEEEFAVSKPFAGLKVALSVHLEAKTAYLCRVMAAGGAEMYITGSNPLSTQDDVAAALVHSGLNVFAWHDCIFYITICLVGFDGCEFWVMAIIDTFITETTIHFEYAFHTANN